MTERQKECFNLGLDRAARLHEDACVHYERLHLQVDADSHKQWAKNIRALYLPTKRPFAEYIKEA